MFNGVIVTLTLTLTPYPRSFLGYCSWKKALYVMSSYPLLCINSSIFLPRFSSTHSIESVPDFS